MCGHECPNGVRVATWRHLDGRKAVHSGLSPGMSQRPFTEVHVGTGSTNGKQSIGMKEQK
jgi:hypothetical protein